MQHVVYRAVSVDLCCYMYDGAHVAQDASFHLCGIGGQGALLDGLAVLC